MISRNTKLKTHFLFKELWNKTQNHIIHVNAKRIFWKKIESERTLSHCSSLSGTWVCPLGKANPLHVNTDLEIEGEWSFDKLKFD